MWAIQALKDDYDVTLVTGGQVDLEGLNAFYGTSLQPSDFTIRQAPVPLWLWMLRKTGVGDALDGVPYQRFCRRIAGDFDVLVSTYNFCDFGIPSIHFIADFSWDDAIRRRFDSGKGLMNRILYGDHLLRRGYLRLSKRMAGCGKGCLFDGHSMVVANSRWSADIIQQKYGCHPQVVYPAVAGDFPIVPWEQKKPEFVSIGRIDPAKRLERIFEILDAVRARGHPVKLHIGGTIGRDSYGRTVRRLAEHRADWVSLHGAVWGEAKVNLLTSCKYGIQAREAEPFGIAVAEMVKAGCIPFVPKEGGQAEIVNHPQLTYADVDDAADKIVGVLEKPQLQSQLCQHLANQGRQFSAESFMSGLRAIVEEFLARKSSRCTA